MKKPLVIYILNFCAIYKITSGMFRLHWKPKIIDSNTSKGILSSRIDELTSKNDGKKTKIKKLYFFYIILLKLSPESLAKI